MIRGSVRGEQAGQYPKAEGTVDGLAQPAELKV